MATEAACQKPYTRAKLSPEQIKTIMQEIDKKPIQFGTSKENW